MKIEAHSADWIQSPCDALIVALAEDWRDDPSVKSLLHASKGGLESLLGSGDVSTKPGRVTLLHAPPGIPVPLLAFVGIGLRGKAPANTVSRAASAAVRAVMTRSRSILRVRNFATTALEERALVAGLIAGTQGQDLFRAEKSVVAPDVIQCSGLDATHVTAGTIIGESVNATRRWVNLPPNYMYPAAFADEAVELSKTVGLQCEVWDQERLEKERCGALLGVARGSVKPPRLVIVRYQGTDPNTPPIALVGKGVTFDSGGYSIKPTDGMLTMKADMAGAATVLGICSAAARLSVRHNIVGVMGLVENLISGDAFKLGDVLTARSGKTIEIHNTDAEGRLVLADCLDIARGYQPSKMVDFATLTGACVVALGNDVAGLMGNHADWLQQIQSQSDRCGEYTWPLPMFPFYSELISGKVADIKNVGDGRWGGAITAAKFLEEFVGTTPWVHVDIAGPAFADAAKPWADAGGTGFLVRSFSELLLS